MPTPNWQDIFQYTGRAVGQTGFDLTPYATEGGQSSQPGWTYTTPNLDEGGHSQGGGWSYDMPQEWQGIISPELQNNVGANEGNPGVTQANWNIDYSRLPNQGNTQYGRVDQVMPYSTAGQWYNPNLHTTDPTYGDITPSWNVRPESPGWDSYVGPGLVALASAFVTGGASLAGMSAGAAGAGAAGAESAPWLYNVGSGLAQGFGNAIGGGSALPTQTNVQGNNMPYDTGGTGGVGGSDWYAQIANMQGGNNNTTPATTYTGGFDLNNSGSGYWDTGAGTGQGAYINSNDPALQGWTGVPNTAGDPWISGAGSGSALSGGGISQIPGNLSNFFSSGGGSGMGDTISNLAIPMALSQFYNSSQWNDAAQTAANRADPFGSQRGQYQGLLSQSYSDPAAFLNDPSHRAIQNRQMNAIESRNRAGGYMGSGRNSTDLADYQSQSDAQYLDTERARLATLSGAQFDPGNAGNLLMRGSTDSINAQNNALGTLGYMYAANRVGNAATQSGTAGNVPTSIANNPLLRTAYQSVLQGFTNGTSAGQINPSAVNSLLSAGMRTVTLPNGTSVDLVQLANRGYDNGVNGGMYTYPTDQAAADAAAGGFNQAPIDYSGYPDLSGQFPVNDIVGGGTGLSGNWWENFGTGDADWANFISGLGG